eukprot:15252642-Alexandrium_andersonii.AAC.1
MCIRDRWVWGEVVRVCVAPRVGAAWGRVRAPGHYVSSRAGVGSSPSCTRPPGVLALLRGGLCR